MHHIDNSGSRRCLRSCSNVYSNTEEHGLRGDASLLVTNAANAASSGAVLTGEGVFLIGTTTTIAVKQPTTPTINYAQAVTVSITITPSSNAARQLPRAW